MDRSHMRCDSSPAHSSTHNRHVVSRTLGYLAAAKEGLSAKELTEVLSRDRVVMQAISSETGAKILVLDGLHGRTGVHSSMDYFEIMYENLRNLKIGLRVRGGSIEGR